MMDHLQLGKLRLLLTAIKVKQSRNIPLSVSEEDLVAECHRVLYSKPKDTITADRDGNVTVTRSVDAEPVIQALKDNMDVLGPKHSGAAAARLFGSLDPLTATVFSKECGAGVGTREFAAYVRKKLADPDYNRFRFGSAT